MEQRQYMIIVEEIDWICFIPESEFGKYFIANDAQGTVVVNEEAFRLFYAEMHNSFEGGDWYSYLLDNYLQSYCLDHAHSDIRSGKFCQPLSFVGVYDLSLPSQ